MERDDSPRLARTLLERYLPPGSCEHVVGDLEEQFASRRRRDGFLAAHGWYWRQSIAAVLALRNRAPRVPARKEDGFMKATLQDVKYGARMIARQPGFSFVVVLTLALAIGANTVIFSFTNVLLIRPLPVWNQDTLGWIFNVDPQRGTDRSPISPADLMAFRESATSFESIGAGTRGTLTWTDRPDALRVAAQRITANLLDIWGIPSIHGRRFRKGEDAPGAAPVTILSHHFWSEHFSADPDVVGRTMMMDGRGYTIVGVLDPSIEIGNLSEIDLWVPFTLDPARAARDERILRVCGRLRPGVSVEEASAEVAAIAKRLQRDYPDTNTDWAARVAPTKEAMTGSDTWMVLALLITVVVFVLLIACANLASLMLARSIERRKEIGVRVALGASRMRLVRQLVTENILLGVAGGGLGLALAYGGLRVIKAVAYEPFFEMVDIDWTVLMFVGGISLLTPVLFSLLPALYASRSSTNEALKEGRRATGSPGLRRGRAVLVVTQLALAMMLLVVASLVVRTMAALSRVDVGIKQEDLLTFQVDLPEWKYGTDEARTQFVDRVLPRLASISGVQHAAATTRLPVLGGETTTLLTIEGRPAPAPKDRPWAARFAATADYFATAGIPVQAGRSITAQDRAETQPVVVINAVMASRYWKSASDAIGERISLGSPDGRATEGAAQSPAHWATIVGVVGNVRPADITLPPNPQLYVPLAQAPAASLGFVIRAPRAETLATTVRTLMREADREVAIYELQTVEQAFERELSSSVILQGMYIAFALVALCLAAAGLYGVTSYSVTQRTQEIGIRMALGAVPGDVRRLVLAQAVRFVVFGAVIGLVGAVVIANAIRKLLYQVSPVDAPTYVAVVAILAFVMLGAAFVPARRAMRVDPMVALRLD